MTTYSYQIQAFQVDFLRKANLTTIGNYLLQTAGRDAESKGFGLQFMLPNNRAWVLARLSIKMDNYPGPEEVLNIQTWIHDIGSILTTRKFNILNGKKEKIGEASSSWVAMDLGSRRPLRLSDFLAEKYIVENPEHQLEPPPRLKPEKEYEQAHTFKVAYSDLDLNKHVYSIRYIQWILDAIPLDHFVEKKIRRLDINYLSETVYGEEILLLSDHNDNGESRFLIRNKKTGKDIGLSKISWHSSKK